MLIQIKSLSSLTETIFSENGSNSEQTAVIVDKNFKLIAKTKFVNRFLPSVRKGTKISKFLPESAVFEISQMQNGSVYRTEFLTDSENFSIVVIRKDDNFLFVFDRLFSEVLKNASEIYGKMSGYDNSIADANNHLETYSEKTRKLLGEILQSLTDIKGLPFFESISVIRHIKTKLQNSRTQKSISFEFSDEKLLTVGNKKDFAAALILLISFSLKKEGDVLVEIERKDEIIEVSVLVRDDGFASFERFNLRNYLCKSENRSDDDFLIYLVKLLSDANLWDLKTVRKGDCSGFSLLLPFIKDGEEFAVREEELDFIDELIENWI